MDNISPIIISIAVIALIVVSLGILFAPRRKQKHKIPVRKYYNYAKLSPEQKVWYDNWETNLQSTEIGGLPGGSNPNASLVKAEVKTAQILDKLAFENPVQEISVLHNIGWEKTLIPHIVMKENKVLLVEDYVLPNASSYGVGLATDTGSRNVLRNNTADISEGVSPSSHIKKHLETKYGVDVDLIYVAHTTARLNPTHETDLFLLYPDQLAEKVQALLGEHEATEPWTIPLADMVLPYVCKTASL